MQDRRHKSKGERMMAELKPAERMKIKRHEMPNQDAHVRRSNFDEVALGYSSETAKKRQGAAFSAKTPSACWMPSRRHDPPIHQGPARGDMEKAIEWMKVKNNLPAICGRSAPGKPV